MTAWYYDFRSDTDRISRNKAVLCAATAMAWVALAVGLAHIGGAL